MTPERPNQHASQLHGAPTPDNNEELATIRPRRRWRRWVFYRVIIGVIVGFVIVGIIKLLNDPVVGTALPQKQFVASPTPKAGLNELAGLIIDLNYPSAFDQVSRVSSSPSALEQYVISSKAQYRRSIAVSVFNLPSGNLDDDSSYKYRLINPSLYKASAGAVKTEPVVLMAKNDHTELTMFWAHGGKLVIVAITSTASGDDVNTFMQAIMPTVRWRQ